MPQHILQRGNNRQATFFTDDDYAVYLDRPGECASKFKVSVHAFILMSNHVHLLATPSTKTGASELMQSVGRYYVLYINKTYARFGTLWEGRFKSAPVDEDGYFWPSVDISSLIRSGRKCKPYRGSPLVELSGQCFGQEDFSANATFMLSGAGQR